MKCTETSRNSVSTVTVHLLLGWQSLEEFISYIKFTTTFCPVLEQNCFDHEWVRKLKQNERRHCFYFSLGNLRNLNWINGLDATWLPLDQKKTLVRSESSWWCKSNACISLRQEAQIHGALQEENLHGWYLDDIEMSDLSLSIIL